MMRIALFLGTNLAVILVASLTLNLLGVGRYLDQSGGLDLQALLAFCAVFGFSGALISLLLSKWMAKMSTRTVIIKQPRNAEEAWLLETVRQMSEKAGIGMPEVGIFPSQQSNAFATGWNKNAALVAVSRGLLDRFTRDEVQAVMGHEIGHVANGDMVTLALIQGVVNTFVMFFARIIGHVVDRAISRDNNGHGIGFYIATFVAEMVLGILASMIVAWFSRRREFRADIAGAQLAGSGAMVAALQRLQQETQAKSTMPDSLSAFGITSGFSKRFGSALATHPPLADRIAALRAGA
ncbi:protease HtpX [Marinagarivorans cellulosilyticus]|uniref:Protease HtpX n=1 Tax=Marinagarivorans cellulosilyticus TaxID=2721545 RepID=A0AAN1WEF4_9GAMM|nr:protease HtpX [Marinagarivorans cellulosilyticus]BCD96065.1 heat shock protein HtpX [Marinagarivorans cellulosilyticus]